MPPILPQPATAPPVWRAGPLGPLGPPLFFVSVFSHLPATFEAPGRPLNERLKTLRPGSVERRNASSMTLTASSSAMFCNAFCIRRDAFCPGRVRICVLLCSMFQAKSWFFRLPRNTRLSARAAAKHEHTRHDDRHCAKVSRRTNEPVKLLRVRIQIRIFGRIPPNM